MGCRGRLLACCSVVRLGADKQSCSALGAMLGSWHTAKLLAEGVESTSLAAADALA